MLYFPSGLLPIPKSFSIIIYISTKVQLHNRLKDGVRVTQGLRRSGVVHPSIKRTPTTVRASTIVTESELLSKVLRNRKFIHSE